MLFHYHQYDIVEEYFHKLRDLDNTCSRYIRTTSLHVPNALSGFVRLLRDIIGDFNPSYFMCSAVIEHN